MSTHLGLQLLLVHVSVLAHQHSVGGGLGSSLGSSLAQTHSVVKDTRQDGQIRISFQHQYFVQLQFSIIIE